MSLTPSAASPALPRTAPVSPATRVSWPVLAMPFAVTTINVADRWTLSIAGADIRRAFDWSRMPMGCSFSAFALLSIVVRPHSNDGVVVKRLLDIGSFNVIFPCVQSAGEARRAAVDAVDEVAAGFAQRGNPGHEDAQAVMARGVERALACGKPVGILAPVEAESRRDMNMGATIVAVGSDLGVFRAGTKGPRELFKQEWAREARA